MKTSILWRIVSGCYLGSALLSMLLGKPPMEVHTLLNSCFLAMILADLRESK